MLGLRSGYSDSPGIHVLNLSLKRDSWRFQSTWTRKLLKVLDLFSGIGGFSLGLERTGGFKTVAFCETEEFPQKILRKHWPDVPIHEDIRTLDGSEINADVITGGYPCQPFSKAGKRRGTEDDHYLWPEMLRLIKEVRPTWVISENVTGHVRLGLDQVLSDLEGEGYATRTFIIPACGVNAPHRRDRLWLTSKKHDTNPISKRLHREEKHKQRDTEPLDREIGDAGQVCEVLAQQGNSGIRSSSNVAYADGNGRNKARERVTKTGSKGAIRNSWWEIEPSVGRVAHGVPRRVDRLKGLGNAVVPQIPEILGRAILEAE